MMEQRTHSTTSVPPLLGALEGLLTLDQVDVAGKRVLVRMDLNAPITQGRVANDARLRAALPTLGRLADMGCSVTVLSHLGRPKEGQPDRGFSLRPVAEHLGGLLGREVEFAPAWPEERAPEPGRIRLAENVRFLPGESANDAELGRRMAAGCDVFIMDAFGTAHRAHASTHAVMEHAPVACAGPLLARELETLGRSLAAPARPLAAIVGGAKVSSKLMVLHALVERVDTLIVGGGIANTFLAATGCGVGGSLYEPDLVDEARDIIRRARERGVDLPLPLDVLCARELSDDARPRTRHPREVRDDEMILDVGPRTARAYAQRLERAKTIFWNGPVGVFEYEPFSHGTRELARAVGRSDAFSIAGGGDTLAAIHAFGVADDVSYVSTGGGAFLKLLEGSELPAVAMLRQRAG